MATYRLTIDGPLWPSLSAMNGKTRSTRTRATNLARLAMWEALHGLALLDRQCAWDAFAVCAHWGANGYPDRKGRFVRHEIGPFIFTLTREI